MSEFLIKEIYQLLFVMSAIYLACVVFLFVFRLIRNVIYDLNTTLKFGVVDKFLLLLSLAVILTYLL